MTHCWRRGRRPLILLWLSAALVIVLWIPACGPQPLTVTREPVTLRVALAESCEPLLEKAVPAHAASRPWVTVRSEVLNNALAVEALMEDRADLALLSWRPVDDEIQKALWMEPFAYDGIAIVVHPTSSFSAIGLAQTREIFQGYLQEWQGVSVTVLSRELGSGTRAAFERIVLNGGETSLNALVMPSSKAIMEYVAGNPSAIGYVSTRCLDERVRALPVEGIAPTEAAVVDGRYPIRRELLLASRGEPVGEARAFAQWMLSTGVNAQGEESADMP